MAAALTRMCIACRKKLHKDSLIRIVLPSGSSQPVLDPTGKLDGRGCYLCGDAGCLAKVIKTRALNRAFKMAVSDEVYQALKGEQ